MIFLVKLIKQGGGYALYVPTEIVREFDLKPYTQYAVFFDKKKRLIFDPITPESYPDLFKEKIIDSDE